MISIVPHEYRQLSTRDHYIKFFEIAITWYTIAFDWDPCSQLYLYFGIRFSSHWRTPSEHCVLVHGISSLGKYTLTHFSIQSPLKFAPVITKLECYICICTSIQRLKALQDVIAGLQRINKSLGGPFIRSCQPIICHGQTKLLIYYEGMLIDCQYW